MAQNNTQTTLDNIENHVPEQLHPILEAAFKHQKQLILGVTAIIIVAAAYAGYSAFNTRSLNKVATKLGTVIIESSGDEKITQLEELLASAPSAAKPSVLLELAKASMAGNKFDKAVDYWGRLVDVTEGDLRTIALVGKAKSLTLAGKAADAVTILKELAASTPEGFAVTINRQLAVAAEQAGDTASALEAYKVLAEKGTRDKPFIDFKIAQLEAK